LTDPLILGQLSGLHGMLCDLATGVPASEANLRFHPELASLAWYLGRSVYRETYWLREVVAGDADLTQRVREVFVPGALDLETQCRRLPPIDHLLSWAREIQDEHLRRLATPGALPAHPLMREDRLPWLLLQEGARDYERMLAVLLARALDRPYASYGVRERLRARTPAPAFAEVTQGHYRIGSRHQPFAYDNELPPQAVELSSYRIAKRPVSNAEYLAFLEAGGYERGDLWSEEGRAWLTASRAAAPWQWRCLWDTLDTAADRGYRLPLCSCSGGHSPVGSSGASAPR